MSLSGYKGNSHPEEVQALSDAFRQRRPVLTDLHTSGNGEPHIGAVSPLFFGKGPASRPVGALIMEAEAREFLYPLIQSWPTSSRSAETLLVRRDGDAVLFLNDLRHQKDMALKLRIPLSRKDIPAVMAVTGKEGLFQGKDYRGVEVLSYLKVIPHSPWFIVAKVDTEEIFSLWRFQSILILTLLLVSLAAAAAFVATIWQRNEKAHYRTLLRLEEERRLSEERYHTTLMSVGDGVIATDADGRVEVMNPVAENLTGWSRAEALNRPLEEVFKIINEKTRQNVENPVRRVMSEGLVVGLANHTILISRDGTERPIADSGAPIRNERGETTGVVLVFRDQTEQRTAETALIESERKYRELIETTQDLVFTVDRKGMFTYINPVFESTLGCSFSELKGKPFTVILDPDEVRLAVEEFRKGMKDAYLGIYETDLLCRDGHRIPVEFRISTILNDHGEIVGRLGIGRDITERRKAEREQALLTRRLEGLWRLAQLAEADYFTFGDHVLAEMLDITGSEYGFYGVMDCEEKEMQTISWSRHVRKDCVVKGPVVFPVESAGVWAEAVRNRRPFVMNDYSETHPAKKGLPEGHVELTRLLIVPVLVEGRIASIAAVANKETPYAEEDLKQLDGFISSAQIVLEKKKSEEELKKAEAKYRSIFENALEGIYQSSIDGRFISVNPAFAWILGYGSPEELISTVTNIANQLYADPAERATLIGILDRQGVLRSHELQMRRKDGSLVWLSMNARAVKDDRGKIIFIEGMAIDVTERKRTQDRLLATLKQLEDAKDMLVQSEKLAAIGRLSAGVGHEILNPLNIISLRIQLLEITEQLSDKVKSGFATMMQQIDRIVKITKDLSQFSRISSKRDLVRKNLNQLVEHILSLVDPRLKFEQVTTDVKLAPDIPEVAVEPDRIEQVIFNIINNAMDALSGKVNKKIRIETDQASKDGGNYVRLVISDNGGGIKPDIIDKIFEPFFTTKEAGKGTGLGLHICHTIIREHGGQIRAENNEEGGASFFIEIPVEIREVGQ